MEDYKKLFLTPNFVVQGQLAMTPTTSFHHLITVDTAADPNLVDYDLLPPV